MAARATVFVTVEIVDVEHGAWCPDCALPSALRITVCQRVGDSLPNLSTVEQCTDCGRSHHQCP